jgi:hypothetical protein
LRQAVHGEIGGVAEAESPDRVSGVRGQRQIIKSVKERGLKRMTNTKRLIAEMHETSELAVSQKLWEEREKQLYGESEQQG